MCVFAQKTAQSYTLLYKVTNNYLNNYSFLITWH